MNVIASLQEVGGQTLSTVHFQLSTYEHPPCVPQFKHL